MKKLTYKDPSAVLGEIVAQREALQESVKLSRQKIAADFLEGKFSQSHIELSNCFLVTQYNYVAPASKVHWAAAALFGAAVLIKRNPAVERRALWGWLWR